jgi:hypothetical protein
MRSRLLLIAIIAIASCTQPQKRHLGSGEAPPDTDERCWLRSTTFLPQPRASRAPSTQEDFRSESCSEENVAQVSRSGFARDAGDGPPPVIKAPHAEPIGEFMAHLYSYPTGRFDPAWWELARVQDRKIASALPAGRREFRKNAALDPQAFTALGPRPLNQGSDRVTGRINDIVVSPAPLVAGDPNSFRVFVASDGGGVWRSDNCCFAGTTFVPVTDQPDIASIAIGDLELDPNDPNTVYAGTGDLRFGSWSFGSAGLLKSTDGGQRWTVLGRDVFTANYPTPTGAFPQYQAVGKVLVNPANSRQLAVGTKTGLYFSDDAGANFVGPCLTNAFGPQSSNPQRQDITALVAARSGASTLLYAAVGARGSATPVQPDLDNNGANGVYRSAWPTSGCPAAGAWSLISRADNGWPAGTGSGNRFGPVGRIELAVAPSAPNVIYAKTISPSDFSIQGVYRSTDGGNSWQLRTLPGGASFTGCAPGEQNWYNAGISVDPNQPEALILSAWWVYRSTDGGNNFPAISCSRVGNNDVGTVHIDQHARAFVGGSSDRLLIGNDGGIYYSENASTVASWLPLNASINAIEFYSGDLSANFADSASRTIIGGAQDNGTSVLIQSGAASAAPWTHIYGGDGITARIEPILGQRVYMSSQRGNIVVSTNGANAPEAIAYGNWGAGQTSGDPKSFLMPFDLYRYGALDVPDSGCSSSAGCAHLIAGTNRVWESTDGASNPQTSLRWTAISPNLSKNALIIGNDNRSVIQGLRFAPSTRRVAMAGTLDGNVWFGFNLGQSTAAEWRDVTGGNQVLPNRPVLDVAVDPATPTIGYAAVAGFSANTPATPGNVFQVRCNADCTQFVWRNVSGNLPAIPANTIIVNPWLPGQVFVGTDWGLYFTNNVNADQVLWQRFDGLPRAMVWHLNIDRGFTSLAAFTRSRGAFVWPLPRSLGQPNLTGLWFVPGEDGWGLSMAHQGDIVFPAWYTYDANGRPNWYLIAGAARTADGSYRGDILAFTGTPFDRINGVANGPATTIGTASFRELSSGRLSFEYTIGGVTQQKSMTRIAPGPIPACVFSSGSRAASGNRSDTWWNPNESGWGLQLTEAGEAIFAAWYTYASDGRPQWITGLLQRGADGRFTGALSRASAGTPFAQINGAAATSFPLPSVGNASLSFTNGERGTFSYTLDGITQSKAIERFVYAGPTQTNCQVP